MIVACPDGGTSIEDLAESNPELILKVIFFFLMGWCSVAWYRGDRTATTLAGIHKRFAKVGSAELCRW